jgi:poly(hydroxyalkanoate) depolymerase family esterase
LCNAAENRDTGVVRGSHGDSERIRALPSLGNTLTSLTKYRRHWEMLTQAARAERSPAADFDPTSSRLVEAHDFGSNPGALRMFKYVPAQPEPALVVVLHGCTQTAASYDLGTGWSTLADRYGFVLLLPQQEHANNSNKCFNWFLARHIERDRGEALSIREMVATMIRDHGIDPGRVYVTGLSAGGAMTSVMLAAYPEIFAGGAVIAGLPYRTAMNINEAFESMFKVRPRPARQWGDFVRAASPHQGPWPRVSVWHGGADPLVKRGNADQIVRQWTDVHGLDEEPTVTETVDGYPRQVWRNDRGEDVIECYTIPDMAHGAPLAAGDSHDQCGIPGAFLLDVGISSSYHIAKFWGLTGRLRRFAEPGKPARARSALPRGQREGAAAPPPSGPAPTGPRAIDIHAVITKALKSAGLWKSP